MAVVDPGEQYKNIGSRTLKHLLTSQGVIQELTPQQETGMRFRAKTARWPRNTRLVYSAIKEGYNSLDSLPVATGLTSAQVSAAVASLNTKGIINIREVPIDEATSRKIL